MLLVIDVGNTQTHVGAFVGAELVEHWRYATDREATGDELAVKIGGLLALSGLGLNGVTGAIASSVVPPLGEQLAAMGSRHLGCELLLVGPGIRTGMPIRMDNPHELGADRLVNATAAYERFGDACVVVDFGTAITFDAVSAAGEYLGGVITPGIEISLEALTKRAAKLPTVEIAEPRAVIGKSTEASIQSGIVYGFAGQVDGIARRLSAELGEGTRFIATGGMASAIVPFTESIDEVDDLLTLTGLRLIHEYNAAEQ